METITLNNILVTRERSNSYRIRLNNGLLFSIPKNFIKFNNSKKTEAICVKEIFNNNILLEKNKIKNKEIEFLKMLNKSNLKEFR